MAWLTANCATICYFFARLWLGTIALKLLGWEACLRAKGAQVKGLVASTSRYRTVVVTLLNSIPIWDKPNPAGNLMFEKNHVSSDCPHPNTLAPTPWAPLKPRDGPRESSRIDLKEGARYFKQFKRTWVGCGWIVGGDVWCEGSFEVGAWKGWNWNIWGPGMLFWRYLWS